MVYESSLVLLFIQKDEQVNTSITILTWKYLSTWWSYQQQGKFKENNKVQTKSSK